MEAASRGSIRRHDPGRRRNLSTLLRRVHVAPATRSELTRETGLNRSTIGALVGDLIVRGLVVEDEASAAGTIGRPSPLVRPSDRAVAIALHPEIDAIRVAAVRLGGRVVDSVRIDVESTPDVETFLALAQEAVAGIRANLPPATVLVGAGVAIPGLVRVRDGFVRLAPHLGWRDVAIASLLEDALGIPVQAANDASLGAAAEWTFGAGQGVDDLLYVNGGASGIGGGIVAGGRPLAGAAGHAGEIGHVTVTGGDQLDSAGLPGTLEAVVRREALAAVLGIHSSDPATLESALARSADPAVRAEVERQVDALAIALASVVNVLGSRRVVLGGFLAALAETAEPRLVAAFERRLLAPLVGEVELRRAALGDAILLIGAASLPFARLLEDPVAFHSA